MNMIRVVCFAFLLVSNFSFSLEIDKNSFNDLAGSAPYFDVKISPNGEKIAVGVLINGKRGFVTLDANTLKKIGGLAPSQRTEVAEFNWATNERLIISLGTKYAWKEELTYYGELMAIDFDGTNQDYIFGYRPGPLQLGSNIKKRQASNSWGSLIDNYPENKRTVLVRTEKMSESNGRFAKAELVDIYSGKRRVVFSSPVRGAEFYLDQQGNIRLAVGVNAKFEQVAFYRNNSEEKWIQLDQNITDSNFIPLTFDSKGTSLYFLGYNGNDKLGYHKINLATGKVKEIYTDKDVDITRAILSSDGRTTIALQIDPDYPNFLIVNSKHPESKTLKHLLKTFAGYEIEFLSRSENAEKLIFKATSATDPGSFYMFNSSSKKIVKLFDILPEVKNTDLADVSAFSFSSSDGTLLHGYLTDPQAENKSPLPMVTLVHGGPHGVRDYWTFNREAQMIARLGYRVLQINYRGSSGYGYEFTKSGYREWGNKIQQDIIEATEWAIENKIADSNKICVMGGSFGAYSAVQSATIKPDLFRCVVAVAGVYDLQMMYQEGDIPDVYYGKEYLKIAIGDNAAELKKYSPVNQLNKLKAPVFLIHGEKDERAPIQQANALKKALNKHNKAHIWYVEDKEGHGFFSDLNRQKYFFEVAQFLQKNL
ncbi:hypothetical protein C1E23_18670 [Pseudoalteromonas phenolica]|uniref:Peptidase S9 prolyl oligopeptidase catalytic domain-containing protein n=1 Tax=Pseudoalteromonas phenolica TaxID=161398 RepID=A0A4Q7IJK9_9GAMM|nr:prolyl oligopeptidase family serine peptidase [Pseudoalteromonas phenolica]RZQ51589.1 hypothetical protein C1E23_18670 [Pseudoalteromonas phenolica]